MATSPQAFYCLWQEERIREKLFEFLPKEDICSIRLASSACHNLVTKRLFLRTNLTFTASTFTKPTRVQALSRIGHHIEHLTFYFPHSDATFLPPLVHPESGREISFLYTPHTSMASVLARPKYANSELGEILTQQYPPLFHAATNVPSFINAMKHIPNMRHLTIKCPGQDPKERYRRDIVDYSLISLRISLERVPLPKFTKLSLSGIHATAFNYLRHVPGFGCRPSAGNLWKQVRKLYISVDSWDYYGPSPGIDHLKIIDDYIRQFAPNLDKFSFTWLGRRGPCPLVLGGDPLFAPPRSSKKLFNEVTSPMSPLPPAPVRDSIKFPRLRHLTMRNATMNAAQIKDLVASHQGTVREFDFENVALVSGGNWDDALAPLMDQHSDRSDVWSQHSLGGNGSEAESFRSGAASSQAEEIDLPSPSAAVAAVSKELLDLDDEGLESFLGFGGVGAAPESVPVPNDDEEDDGGLASDIAAAKEASLAFTTKLKKKRLLRRRRKHPKSDAPEDSETERPSSSHRRKHSHSSSKSHVSSHSHSRSTERVHSSHSHSHTTDRVHSSHSHSRSTDHAHSSSAPRSRSHSRSSPRRRRRKNSTEPLDEAIPASPPHPFAHLSPPTIHPSGEVLTDAEEPRTPTPAPLNISGPVRSTSPLPSVLLRPTVYSPVDGPAAPDDGLSCVQRNLEQEEAHRRLAEDAEARAGALRKAKEAVLAKLSREFHRRMGTGRDSGRGSGGGCAVEVAGGGGGPLRLRQRLFGESLASVAPGGEFRGTMDSSSNSAYVPLMFSRS